MEYDRMLSRSILAEKDLTLFGPRSTFFVKIFKSFLSIFFHHYSVSERLVCVPSEEKGRLLSMIYQGLFLQSLQTVPTSSPTVYSPS
ncbi:hypothetical protein PG991_001743 [Apiospora marii]|uniref:Uncharacterized protein n=1 Tax=Apiospora marii TaxID=335849 RepID=A0ABR1SRX7_9PEZI